MDLQIHDLIRLCDMGRDNFNWVGRKDSLKFLISLLGLISAHLSGWLYCCSTRRMRGSDPLCWVIGMKVQRSNTSCNTKVMEQKIQAL